MKLWIGGELEADVADSFREARHIVETSINDYIAQKDYPNLPDSWDCIAIVRNDNGFNEIHRYSKKKRDMDFRLRLDHAKFKPADQLGREKMIFDMLQRSLSILKEKGVPGDSLDKLSLDADCVAQHKGWI